MHQVQQNMGVSAHSQDCSNGVDKVVGLVLTNGCASESAEHGSAVGADRVAQLPSQHVGGSVHLDDCSNGSTEPDPSQMQGSSCKHVEHDVAGGAGQEGLSLSGGDLGQEDLAHVTGEEEVVGVEIVEVACAGLAKGCPGELARPGVAGLDGCEVGGEMGCDECPVEPAKVGELPSIAGNLSPRLARLCERPSVSAVMTIHVDQSADLEEAFSQVKTKGIRARFPSDRLLRSTTSSHNSFTALDHD